MYIVKNKVNDLVIGEFKSDSEFIDFMSIIVKENGDENFSILGVSDAEEYLNDYCDNLELSQETYTVSLTFVGIESNNPLDAVKKIIGWINEKQGNDLVYDVLGETTYKKYTVDMSEDEEDRVLPNND